MLGNPIEAMTDHQLARSTAEKIRKLNEDIRGGYETTESVEALILAHDRERDRAATQEADPERLFARACLQSSKEAIADGSIGEEDEATMECAMRLGYGNVRRVPYDPAIHGSDFDCEPGDAIWYWGAPTIAPATDRAAPAQHPLQSIIDGKRTPPAIDRAISDNLMALAEPAATARGGETPRTDEQLIDEITCGDGEEDCKVYPSFEIVGADFARTLERELKALIQAHNEVMEEWKRCQENYLASQRALTALQESNREVVKENARLKEAMQGFVEHFDVLNWESEPWEVIEKRAVELWGMTKELTSLRARLALADELRVAADQMEAALKALERSEFGDDPEPLIRQAGSAQKQYRAVLSRWTAPQAAPSPFSTEGAQKAVDRPKCEPASWAVPLKSETVVHHCDKCGKSMTKAEGGTCFTVCESCWDTSRPTATEGGV